MPSIPSSLPSPVGGWNVRDALGNMEPTDAVTLTNWFPRPADVQLRNGYSQWARGLGGQVNAVMGYHAGITSKLFGASGANVYDVTSSGAVGAAVISGATSDKWLHTNVATSGGNFLYLANGADKPQLFDGTNWTAIDGASTPAITGVTTTKLTHPYVAKQRVWFIEINTLHVWYLPVASIGGAASMIDFGPLCRRGGYLVGIAEWSVSGGFGMNDYVVFLTSEGEVLIYQGSDPTSSTTWSLVGIWWLGTPMGYKSMCKFGAELLLICKEGLYPFSMGTFFGSFTGDTGEKGALTDKIQWQVSQATTSYATNYGWQIQPYPIANALILNVPVALGQQQQYVMNTVTGAWCQFTGWAANCWELYKDNVYFGGNGYVALAWNGNDDNGVQITGDAKQAFNYFESRGILKRFTMMRPILNASGQPAIAANVNVDFDDTIPTTSLSYAGSTGSVWDTGTWDSAVWGGSGQIYKSWTGVNGIGYCAAPRLVCAAKGLTVNWLSTDIVMEHGGIL
jgi:hypothetical protein